MSDEPKSAPPISAADMELSPRMAAANTNGNASEPHDEDEDEPASISMLQSALDLAELGMRTHPLYGIRDGRCECGKADCGKDSGKHPFLDHGWQDRASIDQGIVAAWWLKCPNANIGLATGAGSGVVVLDVDGPEGLAALAELEAKHGPIGATPRAQTSRGGLHIYFAHPGYRVSNSAGSRGGIAPGLDVRGDGGYVVAPPSRHLSGVRYAWLAGMRLGTVELLPMPSWVSPPPEPERPRPPAPPRTQPVSDTRRAKYARSALERECELVRSAPEGTRNPQLNMSAFALGTLIPAWLDEDEARAWLLEAGLASGLSKRETLKTIQSGVEAGKSKPRDVADPSWSDVPETPLPYDEPSDGEPPDEPPPTAAEHTPSRIQLVGPDTIFAPLPPMRWVSRDLMIGPGRPTLVIAYGASAKTLAMQSMLLALAAGRPIWNHFAVPTPLRVCHLDYEQGYRDTYHRYQRLALGHGIAPTLIEDRLHVGSMPCVYLTTDGSIEDLTRLAQGFDVVLIDSFRAAALGVDENDSKVRLYIDMLTRISNETGTAFILIHHAGKTVEGRDLRQLGRGSSAIFDACGCVYNLVIGKTNGDPRTVTMSKPPTASEGVPVEPFGLVVQDVEVGGNLLAGVSVTWRKSLIADPDAQANQAYEADAARLLRVIAEQPGSSSSTIAMRAGMQKARAIEVLKSLAMDGRVSVVSGARGAHTYWPIEVTL